MNILITQLTLEQINAAFLRLNRVINNNQASLQSQVTNIISSNIETKDKYNDTAIRALIDALTSRVTDNERDIMNLEGKTQDLSAKIANLSTVIANINCSYNADTNTLTFTNSTGLATNYELKDTTYTFSFDTETQTLTVHNDLDGTDDFVQQITGTTYTFTWNNGTLTIHDNLADSDTTIDLDARYYTESEIDAFITDINNNHNALANRVTTIESKIPSAASSSNQLADKEYVNHSITTATATFRGTVETTTALAALTGDLNDYAFLKIYDETTHSYSYDRYKWVESGGDYGHWKYEYSIENTEFTAPQWEALNSGITCSLVDKITDVYNCKITLCQNGTCKGSFTLNQSSNQTINLDNSTVCAHSSNNINSDLPLLACCSSTTGTLEDAYFNPDVSVNTCCGFLTACNFVFKKGGTASRKVFYDSKLYTGGTRCTAMDIRLFMERFSVCHCLSAGEQLDIKYTWADACNNIICWGTDCSINLTGASVTVLSNSYNSRLWNDSCGGWVDFSVRIQPRSGVAHTFTACKGSSSAVAAKIVCDNNYDYLAYQTYLSRVCGANGDYDRPITFVDSGDGFKQSYYSCVCDFTFNACTGLLKVGNVCVNTNDLSCPAVRKDTALNVQNTAFLLTKAGNIIDNCSLGMQIGSGNINRGIFDYGNSGSFRWLTYYNYDCEIHNLPQVFGCTTKTISIPGGATTYILIGCICSTLYSHGTKLGITVGGSNAVNEAELDMLLTTSDPTYFECNNINVKVSNYKKSRYGISGIGFISTNASGSDAWQCPVCVVLRVCNVSSSAENWHYDVFGLRAKNWTTDIQCLGSTAPTFTKLIPIPACCRSYTYSNASQDITGNICGTLNGCGIADIVNDSVTCAYSGLGASLNGYDFTSSSGCLTLDDFSFDKVCDACNHCVSCGDIVRRIIETNQISGVGYRQRVGLGLERHQNAWGYGLLSIGINDAGTCFTDYRFSCGGCISSAICGTAQCVTVLGRATQNVYRCNLPSANGNCAACVTYVQICTPECRGSIGNSLHLTFYGMMADLNLENSVNYYCGGYYGGLKFSRCSYTCSNCNCFWLAYCGYRQPVLCSAYCFTVLQCIKGAAPEGVTFSCFCDIVTAGVSGIQSIDFNGSSFTVSGGAATLEMNPDICYDTGTSKMCVILGNQTSTEVDLSSLASDHLVAYCGLSNSNDRPLLTGPYGVVDGCICKVYYSSGCPITFNACTGLLKVAGAACANVVCASNYFSIGTSRVSWGYSKTDCGGRASIRLFYDITNWANGTTDITSKGLSGTFTHYRCSGYAVGYKSDVVMTANYGRNNASWSCCNTGCVKLLYDYTFGSVDRPLILYDSTTCKYWLGICNSASSGHTVRFDGIWSGAPETTCTLCYDANGCLPAGWTICTCGTRNFTNRCINVYCGSTCKCNITPASPLCLSANAFNQYAEVDETTYPGVCCTGNVSQEDIASFITMTDVDNCGFMKNFCVYCGSTCKCKISDAGCLKLCANAFNANAQISTTTYPGACCTGTIQGICLNGEEFTTTSGIASLTGFAACDLSPYDNAHTLINGCQCFVFFGCSLSYCCNGTQYALQLRGCAERAGKAMLKCTCENQSYIVPFICKAALGTECTAEFYRSCRDNEPKFNPSTGQLSVQSLCSTFDICTSSYKVSANCSATIVSQNTNYVFLGYIAESKSAVENRIGISLERCGCSIPYSSAQLNLLWIDSSDFSKNSIEIKNVCSSYGSFRIGGFGFIQIPNTTYTCVIAQIIGVSTALTGCLCTYGQLSNNWYSNVYQLNSTPTFDCFIEIPSGKCNFYYNNADCVCFENLMIGDNRWSNQTCVVTSCTSCCNFTITIPQSCLPPYGLATYLVTLVSSKEPNKYTNVFIDYMMGQTYPLLKACFAATACNIVPFRLSHCTECGLMLDVAVCPSASYTIYTAVCTADKCDMVGNCHLPSAPTPTITLGNSLVCTSFPFSIQINVGKCYNQEMVTTLAANAVHTCCISTTSSIKKKKDIIPYATDALGILKDTQIVEYHYKTEDKNDLPHVGVIAEFTDKVISGENQDQLRVSDSIGLLMSAVKDIEVSLSLWQRLKIKLYKKFIKPRKDKKLMNKVKELN